MARRARRSSADPQVMTTMHATVRFSGRVGLSMEPLAACHGDSFVVPPPQACSRGSAPMTVRLTCGPAGAIAASITHVDARVPVYRRLRAVTLADNEAARAFVSRRCRLHPVDMPDLNGNEKHVRSCASNGHPGAHHVRRPGHVYTIRSGRFLFMLWGVQHWIPLGRRSTCHPGTHSPAALRDIAPGVGQVRRIHAASCHARRWGGVQAGRRNVSRRHLEPPRCG